MLYGMHFKLMDTSENYYLLIGAFGHGIDLGLDDYRPVYRFIYQSDRPLL